LFIAWMSDSSHKSDTFVFNQKTTEFTPLQVTPYSPYWVLTTDYTSVAVVYSCTDILRLFHVDYAWILSRSRFLPAETVRYAKQLLVREGIDISRMKATDQNCKDI
ncbi:hypothetical protein XENOCAPTIV_013862, partial [Xenoophorus captivus]